MVKSDHKQTQGGGAGKVKRSKPKQEIKKGKAYVHASYNNTIISLTDVQGNVLASSSAGMIGFKGSKKSTPYAALEVVKDVIAKIKAYNMTEVEVLVRGIGAGRESAIRALNANGLFVSKIKDCTPVPHNGCRPPRVRRV